MGIFGALTTAVTGLRAQSFALENISGNIANSQTTAFKRVDTSFEDLIPDFPISKQLAGSVIASSRATNTAQGDIQGASITFVAVNGAGYFLMGIPVDSATGNLVGSVPELLQFQNDLLPAQPTTRIEYRANLASYPLTPASDKNVPQSELLDPAGFTVDPTTGGAGTVIGSDVTTFLDESVSGGAITAFDATGAPVNIQFRWAKTDAAAYGGTDTWNLFYQVDSNATGATVAWQNVGTDYLFGA